MMLFCSRSGQPEKLESALITLTQPMGLRREQEP
jgi:hypothetical protein